MALNHLEQIKSGKVTRSNVIGIRKAYNAIEMGGYRSITAPKMTSDELSEILTQLDRVRPLCKGELHDMGLKVIRNKRYKNVLPVPGDEVDHFRLIGFEGFKSGNWKYTPEYSAHDKAGNLLFTFVNRSWQSGGNGPELTR